MDLVKRYAASFLVATLGVVGVAYVGARAATAPEGVALTQAEEPADDSRPARRQPRPGLRRAIRGELVVPGAEEGTFETVRIDRGVIDRVEGPTVVISEADGTTVEVVTSGETRISRDGEPVEVGALQAGDHVHALRVETGEGLETRFVRAVSPERREEMEQRREECREDPQACRAERRAPAPGRGPRGGAPPAPAA